MKRTIITVILMIQAICWGTYYTSGGNLERSDDLGCAFLMSSMLSFMAYCVLFELEKNK